MNNDQENSRSIKTGRVESLIKEKMSEFIMNESNKNSFITINFIEYKGKGKMAVVHCSIFPTDKEQEVIEFLKRKEKYAKTYLMKNTPLKYIPEIRFKVSKLGNQVFL